MKKLFISILLLAMLPFAAVEAQDARGRVTSTIVADALNQLPGNVFWSLSLVMAAF